MLILWWKRKRHSGRLSPLETLDAWKMLGYTSLVLLVLVDVAAGLRPFPGGTRPDCQPLAADGAAARGDEPVALPVALCAGRGMDDGGKKAPMKCPM